MGELIEFYVPANFISARRWWKPQEERGKVLAFRSSAEQQSA
jgi:hypothetical protein